MNNCHCLCGRVTFSAVVAFGWLSSIVCAQDLVLITCESQGPCNYKHAATITVQGKNAVRTLVAERATDASLIAKAHTIRISSIPGLYREPKTGVIRVYAPDGKLGDVVLPTKLPKGDALTAVGVWDGVTIDYREQFRAKTTVAVPLDRFVALLGGAPPESVAVNFIRAEIESSYQHPREKDLISGALIFAANSEELRRWRDELRNTMRTSLDAFRKESVDPAQLESTLEKGLAALRVYRLIAAKGQEESALQEELTATHRTLIRRYAIASVLQKAELYDQYLEKIDQIGLARWSRPPLANGLQQALKASADYHYKRATELFKQKQYARAFDEAQLAAQNAPCDPKITDYYYRLRVEFVNRNALPAMPEYENENRNILQQIVRGLDQNATLTPERIVYIHNEIAKGERLDKDYLPLQLKSAEFSANLGELTTAREIVTRLERTVQFGQKEAGEWLDLDASLNGKLETTRRHAEKQIIEDFANGQFKEAFQAAQEGLKAEPSNARLLYFSALSSAIIRDYQGTRTAVKEYLKLANPGCTEEAPDATKTLFELYRRGESTPKVATSGKIPHWMSGELYQPGEVFYDPLSGGFFPRVLTSGAEKGTATAFEWEGFMVKSITTTAHVLVGKTTKETTDFEAEPTYDRQHVCMTEIGPKANSAGERSVTPIRYWNSPQFDPVLAAKFTGKVVTRGWAGNPFFIRSCGPVSSSSTWFTMTREELRRRSPSPPTCRVPVRRILKG